MPSLPVPKEVVAETPRPSVGAGASAFFVANVVNALISFVSSIALGRGLGPTGKGDYDIALATVSLFALVLGMSLSPGITYCVARGSSDAWAATRRLVAWALLQGSAAGLGLAVASTGSLREVFLPAGGFAAIVGMAVWVAGSQIGSYVRAAFLGVQHPMTAAALDVTLRAVTLGAIAVAVLSGLPTPTRSLLAIWSTGLAVLLAGLVWVAWLRRAVGVRDRQATDTPRANMTSIVRFALPAHLGNILQFLNYRLDVFLVMYFVGARGVGIYMLAVSLAQMLWLLSAATATALLPSVAAARDRTAAVRATEQASRVSVTVTVLCGALLGVTAPMIVPTLYGEEFAPSVAPLLLLLPGVGAFSLVNILASFLAGVGRPGLNTIVAAVALAVTLIFDLTLIPALGASGAALASTLSYLTSAGLTLYLFRRHGGAPSRALVTSPGDLEFLARLVRPRRAARGRGSSA